MALSAADGVQAWGLNHVSQLGDGTVTTRLPPMALRGTRAVTDVAAGAFHNLAVSHQSLLAWGWNGVGQLGDGTTTYSG